MNLKDSRKRYWLFWRGETKQGTTELNYIQKGTIKHIAKIK